MGRQTTTPDITPSTLASKPPIYGAVQLDYLFVYGTLMRTGPLQNSLKIPGASAIFVDTAFVRNAYLYDAGDFPVVSIGAPDTGVVWGEVFSFPESSPLLRGHLDFVEGVPRGMFKRLKTIAHLEHLEMEVAAWVYVGAGQWFKQGTELIPSGRWRDRKV